MISFQVAKGLGYRFNIVLRKGGLTIIISAAKKRMGVENSYHCMGVPRTFSRYCTVRTFISRLQSSP